MKIEIEKKTNEKITWTFDEIEINNKVDLDSFLDKTIKKILKDDFDEVFEYSIKFDDYVIHGKVNKDLSTPEYYLEINDNINIIDHISSDEPFTDISHILSLIDIDKLTSLDLVESTSLDRY